MAGCSEVPASVFRVEHPADTDKVFLGGVIKDVERAWLVKSFLARGVQPTYHPGIYVARIMNTLDGEMLYGNAATLVLWLIAEKECHGYQIRKELARRSHDYFQFGFGRLYPLLRRLEQRGLVKGRWVRGDRVRERKDYQITTKGRAALRERQAKWRRFADAMDLVLSSRRPARK